MTYQEYKTEFIADLRSDSAISGSDTEDEFLIHTLTLMADFDEIDSPIRFGIGDKKGRGGRIMRADGYAIDETDHSLILFISDFRDTIESENLTIGRIDELYWRMYYFLDEICNGEISDYFDDSDDLPKIAHLIKRRLCALEDDPQLLLKVKFFVITNKELDTKVLGQNLIENSPAKKGRTTKAKKSTKRIRKADFNNKPLEVNLWYLERFYEMEVSNSNEPIVIDIPRDFGNLGYRGIPCIEARIGENLGYKAYIGIIPGQLLANIYIDHGSKILEGNVRAFLGSGSGKSINSGIRRTIQTDPTKFFTFNNGIATTAAEIKTEEINGELLITKIVDFQVINGGQTTASLAEAILKKTNIELNGIFVPMKLTVIEDREKEDDEGVCIFDQTVQDIAKFANSQNKVTPADLFSNDPFHVWMEKMSKKHLAPPALFPTPSGWYYERSRKKHQQEQFKLRGDALKRFLLKYPKKQIITKEQLGMYLLSVGQAPHTVSRGKSFVMKEFGSDIMRHYKTDKTVFNEYYFKKCVCAAIIFRSVDEYLEKHKDSPKKQNGFWYKTGGYKLNIVPYTISKIIHSVPHGLTLDWDKIWKNQRVSPAFMREVEILTKVTNDFICDSHGLIVTEYCKRQTTWDSYAQTPYTLSDSFVSELLPISLAKENEVDAKHEQKQINELELVMTAIALGETYWTKALTFGNGRACLTYQEQTALKQLIRLTQTGDIPVTASGKVPVKTIKLINSALDVKEKLEAKGLTTIS